MDAARREAARTSIACGVGALEEHCSTGSDARGNRLGAGRYVACPRGSNRVTQPNDHRAGRFCARRNDIGAKTIVRESENRPRNGAQTDGIGLRVLA
jgi:hypothetical protein